MPFRCEHKIITSENKRLCCREISDFVSDEYCQKCLLAELTENNVKELISSVLKEGKVEKDNPLMIRIQDNLDILKNSEFTPWKNTVIESILKEETQLFPFLKKTIYRGKR